jgi:hypothetical protein
MSSKLSFGALQFGVLAIVLTGRTTPEELLAPYAPAPASCQAIDREMEEIASQVAELSTLDTSREVVLALILLAVAVEAINPAFALAPPLVSAIGIDTDRGKERLRYLASIKLHRGCS